MIKYIYVNYAYEDRQMVQSVLARLKRTGLVVLEGNVSEEKVSGASFILNLYTDGARNSRTYKKMANYGLKAGVDSLTVRIREGKVAGEMPMIFDAVTALFKWQYVEEDADQAEAEMAFLAAQAGSAFDEAILADSEEADDEAEEQEEEKLEATVAAPKATTEIEAVEVETVEVEAVKDEAVKIEAVEAETQKAETVSVEMTKPKSVISNDDLDENKIPVRRPLLNGQDDEQMYMEGLKLLENTEDKRALAAGFAMVKRAGNRGYAPAQYEVGRCYDEGVGVGRDVNEGAKWRQMAAYGGHAKAQLEIGYCYDIGHGVQRNYREAARWYHAAADQGELQAINNLAFLYQKGRGVLRDMPRAIAMYQEAARLGNASAQYNLGFCCWYGEGLKIDKQQAIELFEKAAAQGNTKADNMLKVIRRYR